VENRNHDLIAKIEAALPGLSKGQRLIARYIVENYDKAAYMTASALGSEVGVSESTVVRFANEMGYDGYPSLQRQIRETVRVRLTSVQRISSVNDRIPEDEILGYSLASDMENIKSTIETIDCDQFKRAVDLILGARNIYILGMRSSAVLAEFMNYYFGLLFENVRLIRPAGGSEIFEHLMKVHEDDVVVAISFPRYTTGIVNATEYASKTGANVVAITDSLSSPIVPHADAVLVAKSEMVSFVDSLVAPMAVINAMIAYIGKKKHSEVAETLTRLEHVWNDYHVYTSSGEEGL
jgi:DNA-binding MurR/RpiR family transcriptional regulator